MTTDGTTLITLSTRLEAHVWHIRAILCVSPVYINLSPTFVTPLRRE